MDAKRKAGFSVIEVSVVVVIIGILSMMALPAVRDATQVSEATATANNFRVLTDAIEFYGVTEGTYPADMDHSDIPGEMNSYLPLIWKNGSYQWAYFNGDAANYIEVNNVGFTAEQGLKIDNILDDGNIVTGRLRVYNGGDVIRFFFNRAS